jgi:hypothetical protein
MSQYRFEKHQVPASLLLSTGEVRHGCFFVVASLSTHEGPERVGDLLNASERFFPFQHDDGTTGQYNRAHIVLVRLPEGASEEELEPGFTVALRREVRLTLSTGPALEGTVFVTGPVGKERLSDYVRNQKAFWYVVTALGTVIVNSAHVVEIVERSAA